jgi:mitochondrial fission protein ELM1
MVVNSLSEDQQHSQPDCIVLGVKPGVPPSPKPPVRIFLGTQPEQYRPERVFFWSIEQVRDPGRVYEIYLMKGMPGYHRTWLWNTGFTNYRFAIPYYAGYQGRAIYNDVDQTYHADPAELFDMDMGDHAVLAVSRTDTSVMLMDCERMKKFWTLEKAQSRRKYPLIAAVQAEEGAYGLFDESWNVRDTPYLPGRTRCYHYTILHYQPWRPLRERFYYRPNKEGGRLWCGLEAAADHAGFQVFTASRPSRYFDELLETQGRALENNFALAMLADMTADLITSTSATSVLEVKGSCPVPETRHRRLIDLVREMRSATARETYDGVVLSADMSVWPKQDLPWILDELFARAGRFVVGTVHVPEAARGRRGSRRMAMAKAAEWWSWALRAASAHYPEVCWRFALAPSLDSGIEDIEFCRGGAHPAGVSPAVWVLIDEKPGHTTQSLGLANSLGWPYEEKRLHFNWRGELPNSMVKGSVASLRAASAPIAGPPWPDLLIAAGRRTVPIAEWIRQHSLGRTRTVQIGRIGTSLEDHFDVGVAPDYAGLYPDPRRLETSMPLTRVSQASLDEAAERWRDELGFSQGPRVALLVGGTNVEHEFSPGCARELGESVKSMVAAMGGSVLVSTSRRTSKAAAESLLSALGSSCSHAYVWQTDKDNSENPYMGYLALADAFVVTGESASMLAEACTTGKPVAIFPLPARSAGVLAWVRSVGRTLGDAVARCAYARPLNKRGIERPQRGVQRICAGLLAKGWVRTGGHSRQLHESLIAHGLAIYFDGSLPPPPASSVNEMNRVADRVRTLMGYEK